MHTRNRWRNWCFSGLILVLAGCRQREAPNGGDPPAVTPAAPQTPAVDEPAAKDTPAAQPAAPASLEQAGRVIDFRKFPLPDAGKDLYKSTVIPKGDSGKDLRRSVQALFFYLRRVDGAQVAQFCRAKLAEAGWKLGDEKREDYDKNTEYFSFTGSKQGFFLDGGVYVDRAKGHLNVTITNHGNIDSRTLPRFAGAEIKQSGFHRTSYDTDAKPDAVVEFTRAELQKAGWREIMGPGGKVIDGLNGDVFLRFIQRGIMIDTSVRAVKGKTEIGHQVSVLKVELPIMPETKGGVEFWEAADFFLRLYYYTPAEPEKVLEFYRKELPALGWTIRAGTDKIEYGNAKVRLDAPEKPPLRLELLADKQGTAVLIANALDVRGEEIQDKPTRSKKTTATATPVNPGKPHLLTEKEIRLEGKLANDSPEVMGKGAQVHLVKMSPGKTYLIDLESKDFDPYLRILNSAGKQLAKDDDSGDGLNARLRFTPPKEGNYQIVATRFSSGQGNYVLKIRVLRTGE